MIAEIDHHLRILEREKLIIKKIGIFSSRTQSIIELTQLGRETFKEYLVSIKNIINEFESLP